MNYYLIVGITVIISLIINIILKHEFRKNSFVILTNNLTGKEIAEKMLQDNNIYDVQILSIEGELTDHYNPLNKTINLSEDVFYKTNISSAAVAAHECGHAIQHKIGYNMLNLRTMLIPIVNISSQFSNLVIMTGMAIFYSSGGENAFILKLGIGLFAMAVIFSFITLPIEFDASNRALIWLKEQNIATEQEMINIKKSLNWAAMTYVIAALGSLAQLFYFLSVLDNKKE